jgi:hypothetical protein
MDGTVVSCRSQWSFTLESTDDAGDAVRLLLSHMTPDLRVWRELNKTYRVDIFCGLFLDACNRGISVPPDVSRMLAERELSIGFDIYCPEPPTSAE